MKSDHLKRFISFLLRTAEAWIWLIAIAFLAFQDPGCHHYSLCPFHNLGITFCPGCGLGRSITLIFHGDLMESLKMHPLGIPAIVLLIWRSYRIIRNEIITLSNQNRFNYG